MLALLGGFAEARASHSSRRCIRLIYGVVRMKARTGTVSGTARKRRREVAHSVTIPLYCSLVYGSRIVHMGIVDGSRRAIGGHGGACGALSGLR